MLVAFRCDGSVQRKEAQDAGSLQAYALLRFDGTAAEQLDGASSAAPGAGTRAQSCCRDVGLRTGERPTPRLEMACSYARERKGLWPAHWVPSGHQASLANLYTNNQLARAHCYYGAWR